MRAFVETSGGANKLIVCRLLHLRDERCGSAALLRTQQEPLQLVANNSLVCLRRLLRACLDDCTQALVRETNRTKCHPLQTTTSPRDAASARRASKRERPPPQQLSLQTTAKRPLGRPTRNELRRLNRRPPHLPACSGSTAAASRRCPRTRRQWP